MLVRNPFSFSSFLAFLLNILHVNATRSFSDLELGVSSFPGPRARSDKAYPVAHNVLESAYGSRKVIMSDSADFNVLQSEISDVVAFNSLSKPFQCPCAVKSDGYAATAGASRILIGITVLAEGMGDVILSDHKSIASVESGSNWGP